MQFKSWKKLFHAAAVVVAAGFANRARAVVPEYTLLDLNTLGGGSIEVTGVNSAGQVVGYSTTSTGSRRGFLTAANSAIDPVTSLLPLLSGGNTNTAFGINSSGVVTGWSNSSGGDRMVRYNGGTATSLGTIQGNFSYGEAITDAGRIVGSSSTQNGQNPSFRATLYNGSSLFNLGALSSSDDSFAYSINSTGSVVGYSGDPAGAFANAFLWTPTVPNGTTGTMVDLGNLGGDFNYAFDINDTGQIVGGAGHAFLRNPGGSMQDLGTLGGTSSEARGINNLGMIVGMARNAAAANHAFIHVDGAMHDLNDLIPAGGSLTLMRARAINDLGQIGGVGTTTTGALHGFLLTPLPTWAIDNDGSWSGSANWLGGVPSGSGAEVRFTGAILAPRTVTLDAPRTIGHLVFDNANRYTLGGGTLTISGAAANTGIEVRNGGHTISAPLSFVGAATISLANNTSLKISGSISGAIKSLQLGNSATLDLTSNSLLINYAPEDGSPLATIFSALSSAFNGGSWNGTGLTSSNVAAVAADLANPHKTALGYAEASAIGLSGANIDSTTLFIRATLSGDSNLDGKVNALDFNALAANFGAGGRHWLDGDFTYDGTVNSMDFSALATNFGSSLPAGQMGLGAVVPEPSILCLGAGVMFLSRRRRANSGNVSQSSEAGSGTSAPSAGDGSARLKFTASAAKSSELVNPS
jgi:probable HAF family extracellular repeat protein